MTSCGSEHKYNRILSNFSINVFFKLLILIFILLAISDPFLYHPQNLQMKGTLQKLGIFADFNKLNKRFGIKTNSHSMKYIKLTTISIQHCIFFWHCVCAPCCCFCYLLLIYRHRLSSECRLITTALINTYIFTCTNSIGGGRSVEFCSVKRE